jgi:hypothetical protein
MAGKRTFAINSRRLLMVSKRSSGAYSMSIWMHNLNNLDFNSSWSLPNGSKTEDVLIAGSGNNWNTVYTAAEQNGKAIVGGGAKTVGLGGFIQGGGHGPLSSHYGLAADQILQVTVVTTDGQILTANAQQNQDLLWAIRGGGAGQYGVVTEYILKAYPAPTNAILGTLTMSTNGTDNASISAAWNAFAVDVRSISNLMDSGLNGALTAITKQSNGRAIVSLTHQFVGYNTTAAEMTALLAPVIKKMNSEGSNATLSVSWTEPITYANFTTMFDAQNPSQASAGAVSMMSSRLLGPDQLNNITQTELVAYLQRIMTPMSSTGGGYLIMGMQGGLGPARVPEDMRGALNPVWRKAYLHTIVLGSRINATADSKIALGEAATWLNENIETVWQEWAPDTGSYMNEANPYNLYFKHDYYGINYEKVGGG